MSWPWSELGLTGPASLPEIRHAYAQQLKTAHPEEDPEGFQRLHSAYRLACRLVRQAPEPPAPEPPKPDPDAGYYEAPYARDCEEDESGGESNPLEQNPDRLFEDRPLAEEPDWDFDRLFAEGQAERDAAFRRQAEESRRRNEAGRWGTTPEARRAAEDAAWAAVLTALHALELLESTNAGLPVWKEFFSSPTFWGAKSNLDFVFGLEDFLEDHPDLPPEVRNALFLAYGFEEGPVRMEYRSLYRALGGDERRRLQPKSKKKADPRRLILCLLALVFLFGSVGTFLVRSSQPKETWQERICRYMEEDFGRAFLPRNPGEASNLFLPADDPSLIFLAATDGKRDLENGKRGYKTNYTNVLVTRAMEEFTAEWGYDLTQDSAGGYEGQPGESPGAYYIGMPLTGGDGGIIAMGELLEELKKEDWYQELPPVFEVQLSYRIWSFYICVPTEEDFDVNYARTVYLSRLGPEMCRHLADWSGVAETDLDGAEHVLLEQGSVLIDGDTFFWVSALEPPPESGTLAEYFLSADGLNLICVPPEMVSPTLSQQDLFSVTPETCVLEGYGEGVTIWDLIRN